MLFCVVKCDVCLKLETGRMLGMIFMLILVVI